MHQSTAERIVQAANLSKKDLVLEIGPGTGMLTHALLTRAKRVIAVEKDYELYKDLVHTFEKEIAKKKLTLIHGDIRTYTPPATSYKVVANIPYYITGEIIRQFLTTKKQPSSMTLLVQKEVAQRIARSRKESLLSLSIKIFGDPTYCFTVPRGAFVPTPSVDSAVVHIAHIQNPFRSKKDGECFFVLLHAGFAHKRKLLIRNLEKVAAQKALQSAFSKLTIPINTRAEDVSLTLWKKLAYLLA